MASFSAGRPNSGVVVLGLSNGQALVVRHRYRVSFPDDRRVITPEIEYSLGAFAHLDTGKAVEVWSEDRLVDREYESLMRELMTYMMEDPSSIPCVLQAMFAARAIERIGDRAGNICEYVIYLVKGKDVRHTRVDQQDEG